MNLSHSAPVRLLLFSLYLVPNYAPGKTCVQLMVDGVIVHPANGSATKDPQKRKIMSWVTWDVSKFTGKEARLRILDQHSGGWGHIMVDHIFQSNRAITKSRQ